MQCKRGDGQPTCSWWDREKDCCKLNVYSVNSLDCLMRHIFVFVKQENVVNPIEVELKEMKDKPEVNPTRQPGTKILEN